MASRVYLSFNPEAVNRGRKGGFGVWRVVACIDCPRPLHTYVYSGELALTTTRPYRRGTIVNPARLALDYTRSQHGK